MCGGGGGGAYISKLLVGKSAKTPMMMLCEVKDGLNDILRLELVEGK